MEGSGYIWCFLEGGEHARVCPGAVQSTSGGYWSKSEVVCNGKFKIYDIVFYREVSQGYKALLKYKELRKF